MAPELGHLLDSLGWAILHSLWQGAFAAIAVVLFRGLTKDSHASLRYGFETACLLACLAAFMTTFGVYQLQSHSVHNAVLAVGSPAEQITALFAGAISAPAAGTQASLSQTLTSYTPLLGILWCLGFVFFAARYCGAFMMTQRLRRVGISEAPSDWQRRFETLVLNSGIRRHVKILISSRVSGPLTLGFFKPIVLVPASFFAGLPAPQVEAILLHEIAHIRRHDYLINLFQTAIKTIFFFHPAVHYISRKIDNDREHACDDFAVSLTRDPQSLARGLAALRMNFAQDTFALAADNGNTPLVARLKRLGNVSDTRRRPEHVLTSAATLILAAGLYVSTSPMANANPPEPAAAPKAAQAPGHPSAKTGNYRFEQISKNGKTFTAKIADDGTRWISVDGAWHDVDRNPEKITALPEIPVAPKPPVSEWTGSYVDGIMDHYGQYKVDLDYYIAGLKYAQLETVDPALAGAAPAQSDIKTKIATAENTRSQIERTIESTVEDALQRSLKEKEDAWKQARHNHQAATLQKEADHKAHKDSHKMAPGIYINGEYQAGVNHSVWIQEFEKEMTRIATAEAYGHMSASKAETARVAAHDKFEEKIERTAQQHERAMEQVVRAEEQRERAQEQVERAEERREAALERAEAQREREMDRAEARAEREREREKDYKGFSDAMLTQLEADGLIKSGAASVTITYPNWKMAINGKTVPDHLEDNYCELVSAYGFKKTDKTKIKIKPGSFEYKAVSEDGSSSRHIEYTVPDKTHKDEAHQKGASLGQTLTAPINPQDTNWTPVTRQLPVNHTKTDWTPINAELPEPSVRYHWSPQKSGANAADLSFTHPTPDSRVSQSFNYINAAGKRHGGVDLASPHKTPIKASAPGIVTYAKTKGKWGNMIKITHDGGYETHYAHVGEICVDEGDQVSRGHNIGTVGSADVSSGPHLHFEIRRDGESLNPEGLIQGF